MARNAGGAAQGDTGSGTQSTGAQAQGTGAQAGGQATGAGNGQADAGAAGTTGGDGTGEGAGAQAGAGDAGASGAQAGGSTEAGGQAGAAAGGAEAPASYQLTMPDGAEGLVSTEDVDYLKEVAAASKWSKEDAQAELNALVERAQKRLADQSAAFKAQTEADPNYGGEKLAETQRLTKLVIDKVRPAGHPRRDSFLAFLGRGGAANHIDVVSFLADLGKMMAEDSPAQGSGGGGGDTSMEDVLYDHPTSRAAGR